MRLILVRHGETDWNRERRVQGHSDVALCEEGLQQAEEVAKALQREKIVAIYSSPLQRALQTAQAVAKYHSLPVETVEDLKELDVGELDGLSFTEMRARYGDFLKQWAADAGPLRLPQGESLQELQERAWKVVEQIRGKHREGTVVVVSHNFALNSIICKAIGLSLSCFRRLRTEVAAISVLDFTERGPVLVLLNERCHLRQPEDRGLVLG